MQNQNLFNTRFNEIDKNNWILESVLTSWIIHFALSLHIKLFPQRDEHLFFSVPGVRDH